jgi:valyl-tRNA synthetase
MNPVMPFVTEEVYSFMPDRGEQLVVRAFPEANAALIDEHAEREIGAVIEATRRLRSYRNIMGVPAAARIPARLVPESDARGIYESSRITIERLARFDFSDDGDATGAGLNLTIPGAAVELLPSEAVDLDEARARIGTYVERLRSEKEGAERRLANQSFVENAPAEVVEQWREKLAAFERELADLDT